MILMTKVILMMISRYLELPMRWLMRLMKERLPVLQTEVIQHICSKTVVAVVIMVSYHLYPIYLIPSSPSTLSDTEEVFSFLDNDCNSYSNYWQRNKLFKRWCGWWWVCWFGYKKVKLDFVWIVSNTTNRCFYSSFDSKTLAQLGQSDDDANSCDGTLGTSESRASVLEAILSILYDRCMSNRSNEFHIISKNHRQSSNWIIGEICSVKQSHRGISQNL